MRADRLAAALALLFAAAPAGAQPAADKATARTVASEGIELYRKGDFAGALDRMKRAQELYPAPVHLLYLGRAHARIGQLVEASEAYRLLVRTDLAPDAPRAFAEAVEDGRKELAELEPRLPSLTLRLEPPDAPEPKLRIDGQQVSAAVLGIARPLNPGEHVVVVEAAGHAPAEVRVAVAEGERKDVAVPLEPLPAGSAPPPVAAPGAKAPAERRSAIGFLAGLRLGFGIPTGTIGRFPTPANPAGEDVKITEPVGAGGGLELHAGVRIARIFTPVLYFEGHALAPGRLAGLDTKNAGATNVGIALLVGTPPRQTGGFGEVGIALSSKYGFALDAAEKCEVTLQGGALRLAGGGTFPLSRVLHLSPFAMFTLGRFSEVDVVGCTAVQGALPDGAIPDGKQATHAMISIGAGGDFAFGGDLGR